MHHLVHFKTAEGREGHHIAESLDEAAQFAERLRNSEGAINVVLYRLTEVPIEFKTYYRVAVKGADLAPPPVPTVTPNPTTDDVPAAFSGDGLPESAAANGRRLFSRT